jgi:hypothetical protein
MPGDHHLLFVSEVNPKPDNYVPIFHVDKESKKNKEGFSVFVKMDEALNRAQYLCSKYSVKQIRLFYKNKSSVIIKKVE